MTTVYYVRHAKPNYDNHDDELRELTEEGLRDRSKVTKFLQDKKIDVVFSSPYKRAIDTIGEFAEQFHFDIQLVNELKERKIDSEWIDDFTTFCRHQWEDFEYKLSDGESLSEVQKRNIEALLMILENYQDKNIVIGGHGTALSTIIHYYDSSFGYEEFEEIKGKMPLIVKFQFHGLNYIDYEIQEMNE